MGVTLNGKTLATKIGEEIKEKVAMLEETGNRVPCLSSILIGDDGGSVFYVNSQKKRCEALGVEYRLIHFKEDISEEEVIKKIQNLNNDVSVDGIIVQLPLPKHIDEKIVMSSICPEKDVDCQTDINAGRFFKGEKSFISCTPKAVLELVKETGELVEGKHVVVVGRSNIVGKPLAQLFLQENATVTICHSKTNNLLKICKEADILVACVGSPEMIVGQYVKDGSIVIDVGTSRVNGKMVGDVKFDEVIEKASYITPVPGGVGAVTTTMLIKNTCEAYEMKKD